MLRSIAIASMSLMMMACASGPSYTNTAGESAATANLKYNIGLVQIEMNQPDVEGLPNTDGLQSLLTQKLNEKLAEANMKASAGDKNAASLNIFMQYWRNLAGSAFNSDGEGTGIANPWFAFKSNVKSSTGQTIGTASQAKLLLDLGMFGNLSQMGNMFSGMDPKIEEGHLEAIAEQFVERLQNGN